MFGLLKDHLACTAVLLISLAFGQSAVDAAPKAPMQTYQSGEGQAFFAISLSPDGVPMVSPPGEVVLLVDTSASQAGVYRETALAALETCLGKLRPSTRVKVVAVDLDARPASDGFIAPQGTDAAAAVDAIREIPPLGSTDFEHVLQETLSTFDHESATTRSVVYIGDGLSRANLLGTETFKKIVDKLVAARVSVSSYAVGPRLDTHFLAALANQTGGNLYVDEGMVAADDEQGVTAERAAQENHRRGNVVGAMLASWVGATVAWPEKVTWPAELGKVYPARVPPLRTDRDTIVVGSSERDASLAGEVQLTAEVAGQVQNLSWTLQPQKFGDDRAFLSQVVDMAEQDGGVTLPTLGTVGLLETGRLFQAQLDGLTSLAERAVATGDMTAAKLLSQAVLQKDPRNLQAQTVQRVVNRKQGGATLAQPVSRPAVPPAAAVHPAEGTDLSLVRLAQAEPAGEALPSGEEGAADVLVPADGALIDRFAEEGALLDEVAQQKQVFAQMLRREVQNTITEALKVMADNPALANQDLKLALQNVERAPELGAGVRAQLVDKLQTTLRQVQRASSEKDERDREQEAQIAADRERQLLMDRLARDREKVKQLVDRFDALLDERRYVEAEEVADVTEEIDPGGVMPRMAIVSGRFQRNQYLQQVVRAARWRNWYEALYQVELSSIPFPDDPPIVYPDPEVWEELTIRRKKYASVDLSARGGSEERIENALKGPLTSAGLEFLNTPLEETVQFLRDEYEIPIHLDTQALEDVGISSDEPININVRSISLRSALRLMLSQLDLTYIIKDEVMLITTPEEAETELAVKVYPVADLVLPIPSMGGMGGGMGGMGMGGGMGGMGGGMGGMGGGMGGMGGGMGGMGGGGGFFSVPEQEQPFPPAEVAPEEAALPVEQPLATAKIETAKIEIDPSQSPEAFWNAYFAGATRDPAVVRQAVRDLMGASRPEQVTALIQAALRAGVPQPWMYESLGIAMELAGQSKKEIERAIMSAADFSTSATELLYIAQYLSRVGFDQRALALYQQVVRMDSMCQEAYLLGLRAAQRSDNIKGIQWATVGILSQAWPKEQSAAPKVAYRVANATLEQLGKEGRHKEREDYQRRLQAAFARDCIVRISWTGDADVDLFVEEPAGAICSSTTPRTTGGGLMLGDGAADQQDGPDAGFVETYICPRGFAGTYRARVHRVWGEVAAGKVTVEILTNFGTDQFQRQQQQVDLGKKDAVVIFDLEDGHRKKPLEAEKLARAVRRQQQIGHAILAQQIDSISDRSIIPLRPEAARRRRLALGQGAVGYQPVIITLPEGTTFSATGVVSADRRYVRVSPMPFFSTVREVQTFTYAGRAQQVGGGDDDGGGGNGGNGGNGG